eukprot:TRINITY_DN486_c0_g1_i5.p1 TRINITY_DN486_c0_g1~~TRINITY_DN486_c0_g1_i5.p1  ORF type:complete len:314 (+),score=44.76 TRINITY_DN486_c0_g1_i5:66-944(+)
MTSAMITNFSSFRGCLRHPIQRSYQQAYTCYQRPKSISIHKQDRYRKTFAAAEEVKSELDDEQEEEEEDVDVCFPAFVYFDNEANEKFTTIQLEISDYPGLLRVIAWVIEGLDLVVQNALLKTTDDGLVSNTFYVTDSSKRKLNEQEAQQVVERLREFVTYCSPAQEEMEATELKNNVANISNTADPNKTEVVVNQAGGPPNLLQLACVITGAGAIIREAVIQSCENCAQGVDVPQFQNGQVLYRFLVTDRAGNKLDYQRSSSLLYTLSLAYGSGGFPTSVPRIGIGLPHQS